MFRTSDKITEGRGFKFYQELEFPSLCFSTYLLSAISCLNDRVCVSPRIYYLRYHASISEFVFLRAFTICDIMLEFPNLCFSVYLLITI